ncbi:MAG: hypothetical protein FWD53_12620 [Phycisphaerales bacterium]|nr:hypothetical protein [Phycisphaerales bacterium]
MSKRKANQDHAAEQAAMEPSKKLSHWLTSSLLPFTLGTVLTAGMFLQFSKNPSTPPTPTRSSHYYNNPEAGHRTVAQLMALSDDELEKVDVLELNIAVAREIPGLENLDYNHYRQIVDNWTDQFRRWLPTVEYAFHEKPDGYKNDINFFRLGMLSQFLGSTIGIRYVPEQKEAQDQARKAGMQPSVLYTNPGHLLVHGLIDTTQGTCGNMPTLNVIMGRRMGWPVSLACVKSHYVCRYDDSKVYYNIEATAVEHGGFGEGSDEDYIKKGDVSGKAIASGSDLRKLSTREMLGTFVTLRARYFADTERWELADRDYALARAIFPNHRQTYKESLGSILLRGESLFDPNEQGHPYTLHAHLASIFRQEIDHLAEAERIDAINRANMERAMRTREEFERINAINRANQERMFRTPPGMSQPRRPGIPQPYQQPGFQHPLMP